MQNQIQNNFEPKYYRIKQIIQKDIEKGKYEPNSRIPSITQLMKQYEIARATATRVTNEMLKDNLIYTIPGSGCYVSARKETLKKGNAAENISVNKRIVYISSNALGDEYYYKVQKGILGIIQSSGYELVIYDSEYSYEKENELLSRCIENPPAGIIFIPKYYEEEYKHLFHLRKMGVPVVLVGQEIKNSDLDYVGVDGIKSTVTAVKYLIKSGHRRIAFLGMTKNNTTSFECLEGYKKALEEKKIKFNPELIFDARTGENGVGPSGYRGLKKAIAEGIKFSAIISTSDVLAMEAYRILKERGIKVPGDVSIIGANDLDVARNFELSLTTIKHDMENVGSTAAKLLLKRIDKKLYKKPELKNPEGTEKIFLNAKLTVRDSVRDMRKNQVGYIHCQNS